MIAQYAFIELTSFCNFKCTFCPSEHLERERCNLDFGTGKKFIDDVHKINDHAIFQFNVLGEPFINQDIFRYLDYISALGHQSQIITNISLMSEDIIEQLFKEHQNFVLVLSLQTPTEQSYVMRGYQKENFDTYKSRIAKIVEAKFRYNNTSDIEIHVASTNHIFKNDSTFISDYDYNPWEIFPDEDAEKAWHKEYLNELDKLQNHIKRTYHAEYVRQKKLALDQKRIEIKDKRLITKRYKVPDDMFKYTEDILWGYMFLPFVHFRYKTFGLWTKEYNFLKSNFDIKNSFIYVENLNSVGKCPMADNIGILSNGSIVTCCLDYEGEMNIGNESEQSILDSDVEEKINSIRENALSQPLCQRCLGNVHIFNTEPENADRQKVTHYCSDWWPYEPTLNSKGGRWSKGSSSVLILARIDADHITYDLTSPYDDGTVLFVKFYEYDFEKRAFYEAAESAFTVNSGTNQYEIKYDFKSGNFYKVTILPPQFSPKQVSGSADGRNLGVAVHDIFIGRCVDCL